MVNKRSNPHMTGTMRSSQVVAFVAAVALTCVAGHGVGIGASDVLSALDKSLSM